MDENSAKKKSSIKINISMLIGGIVLVIVSFLFTQFFVLRPGSRIIPDFGQIKALIGIGHKETTARNESAVVEVGQDDAADTEESRDSQTQLENAILKVSILDYPKLVENICQEFKIKMALTNNGEKPLKFENFNNGDYYIDLVDESLEADIAYIDTVLFDGGSKIDDFGIIEPGETKELTYLAADKVQGEDESGNVTEEKLENPFTQVKSNGIHKLRVEIGTYGEENEDILIGMSETFPVELKVMLSEGVFKACH
jgi:hypothetical protein